jgi:hypothetical protein
MYFVYGTREKLKKDVKMGLDYCPNCGKFTAWFAGRHRKYWHFDYIPLYIKTLNCFVMCGSCEHGREIDKQELAALKENYQPFKDKKQQIACYQEAEALAKTMMASDAAVDTMMQRLSEKYPIKATPFLEAEYRRRFGVMLQLYGLQANQNQP